MVDNSSTVCISCRSPDSCSCCFSAAATLCAMQQLPDTYIGAPRREPTPASKMQFHLFHVANISGIWLMHATRTVQPSAAGSTSCNLSAATRVLVWCCLPGSFDEWSACIHARAGNILRHKRTSRRGQHHKGASMCLSSA